jgi:regulator of RNase E activity RraB
MDAENTWKIHTINSEQENLLKAFVKAFKLKYEILKKEKPYNPEFVAKIKESQQQAKDGKTVKIALDDIWK